MFADPDILMPYQLGKNSAISFSGPNKLERYDLKNDYNKIKQSSHLQMTWVQDSPKTSKNQYSETTFLTNVNSISSLDPVIQEYIDQQIPIEFNKLSNSHKESIENIKKMFEFQQKENLNIINDLKNSLNTKNQSIDLQIKKYDEIKQILENHEKRLNDYDQKFANIEKLIIKNDKEKLFDNEKQQLQSYKDEITQKFKDAQQTFTDSNVSTLKCITHLEEKINDFSKAIETIEKKFEIESNELQVLKTSMIDSINESHAKFNEQLNKAMTENKNGLDKYALKTDLEPFCKSIEMLKQNIKENQELAASQNTKVNQHQKDLQVQIFDLKEKIINLEKKSCHPISPALPNSNQNTNHEVKIVRKDLNDINIKMDTISNKIEELEKSLRENNGILMTYSSIPSSISNLKTTFDQSEIFFKNEISTIKNDIKILKFKSNNRSIQKCFNSIDITGTGDSNGLFNLTIGEPDISSGGIGTQLCLTKSYQDYTFNISLNHDPDEFYLKEPSGLKSARRKIKSRKFKKP